MKTIFFKQTVSLLILMLMVGCVSSPKRDLTLERLEDELQNLKNDTQAQSIAPLQVSDAEQSVRLLRETQGDINYRNHLGYLAERRIDLVRSELRRQLALQNTTQLRQRGADLRVRISNLQAQQARREAEQALLISAAQTEDAARARRETIQARELEQSAAAEAEKARLLADAQSEEVALARREAELVNQEAASLRRRLEHMQLRETERGVVVTLGDVSFETGQSELKDDAAQNVADVVDLLQSEPDKRIRIEGHTDSTGAANLNQALSERRAEAVETALVKVGVDPNRIEILGLGENFPIATNETDAGRRQNRRVDVILLDR